MDSRSESGAGPAERRWGAAFFVLMALTPVTPYIKIPAIYFAINDFPPMAAVLCGIMVLAARYRRGVPLTVALVALCTAEIALLAAASTAANGLVPNDWLAGPLRWTETTLIIGLAFVVGSDRQLRSMFVRVAVLAAAGSALFGIGAFVTGWIGPNYLGIESFRAYNTLYGTFPGRITGTLGLPSNGSGVLFALALPIGVGYALGAKDRVIRIRWVGVAVTLAVALLFTFSRVPIVLGLMMVVVLLGVRLRPAVALTTGAAFFLLVAASPLRSRFSGDGNDRLSLWATAINMTRDHALLGVGPEQYREYLPEYAVTSFGVAGNTAHNSVLEATATLGVPAGLLLVLAIILSMSWLPTAMRLKRARPEVLGAWLGLSAFLVASLTVNYFFWPQLGLLFWVMAVGLSRWAGDADGEPDSLPDSASSERRLPVPVEVRRAVMAGRGAP